MRIKHVVSLSGGKDSTAMLLMMLERGMQIDDIVFCDTGLEFPQMYKHIEAVERRIGRKINVIKSDKTYEYYLADHILTKGKHKGLKGYGYPSMRIRWCTARLKLDVLGRYFRKYTKEGFLLKQYIGIAADEQKRCKEHIYPLVEWGITEAQALQYCYGKGFDWGGLYKDFRRVSCYCCPLQPLKELKILWKKYPELWQKMEELDTRTASSFRLDYTLAEIEQRFIHEDWGKQGE
ncbi:phosphoadenosine phosphosulfate reductase domain-containing protein [Treponema lecithinolyticum]